MFLILGFIVLVGDKLQIWRDCSPPAVFSRVLCFCCIFFYVCFVAFILISFLWFGTYIPIRYISDFAMSIEIVLEFLLKW